MGKMKKIRLCIGILAFALMMPMSGCSVSISFGTNKDTEAEKETEEKTANITNTIQRILFSSIDIPSKISATTTNIFL